ncbi:hypothetical protein HPB51_009990 [Rhipicephalus microplus]|uniref:COP9 signalosome complex subunit 3 N-terminal helical repeats domain-containing protein n=1 Tax=Rhipicephalus microplus TaxID=6941 RepID=A0A9J6ESE9_RHIMP|nr:hypothetical protein HPB51_009990 [Rhipicephalus microplus]
MTTPLEQFVVNVQNMSSSGSFSQLYTFISKSSDMLMRNASHLEDVLATLDLQKHSLGVLAILCVKFSVTNAADFDVLYAQVQEFILGCNGEQVRCATDTFADLCHLLTQSLVERQQPMRGIQLLSCAITKIQLLPSQLTSIHADLCQLCLLAKCLKPALQFLDVDITDISRENDQYDAKHFLLYFYYGGMIYTALKNYERALYFFEVSSKERTKGRDCQNLGDVSAGMGCSSSSSSFTSTELTHCSLAQNTRRHYSSSQKSIDPMLKQKCAQQWVEVGNIKKH